MTKEELLVRLQDIEWDDFEAKAAENDLPQNIWDTVSAFSNTAGGWIVLGVKQNGSKFEVQGINNGEKIESNFLNVLRGGHKMNYPLFPTSKKYNIDGRLVLAFHIESSPHKPIFYTSIVNTFIRSGSGDRRATDAEISAMYRDQMFGCKSEEIVKGTSIANLNAMSLESFRNHVNFENKNSNFKDLTDEQFCEKTGITKGGELTYSGLLMLGSRDAVMLHTNNFWIDYLEIPGTTYANATTRYTFRMQEQDNIWESYKAIVQRLRLYTNNPFVATDTMAATEDDSELYSLREGLINMCAHADYFSPMHPTIRVFTNRIEFQNPGRIMVDIEHLKDRIQSNPRNPGIIKLFRYAKLSENAGYGIDKMLQWEKLTGNKVCFDSDLTTTVVTYYLTQSKTSAENVTETTPKTTPETTPKTTPKTSTSSRDRIIETIMANPTITKVQMCELLGMKLDSIKYHTKKLNTQGIIKWIGPTKGGHWEVTISSYGDSEGYKASF